MLRYTAAAIWTRALSCLAFLPSTLGAQVTELRQSCTNCGIAWTRIATLGGEGADYVGMPTSVVRNSRGQYLVASDARRSEILLFGPEGNLLRTIGREGQGPGEFTWAGGLAIAPGDTLHVLDAGRHLWTVMSPTFGVLGSEVLPGSYEWDQVAIDSRTIVANLYVGTPDRAGHPLHLLSLRRGIVRSFGAPATQIVRRGVGATTRRRIARSKTGGVWAGRINEYRIELFDLEGEKRRELRRPVPWFEPWQTVVHFSPSQPPQTQLAELHEDSSGLLWVIFQVADRNWNRAVEEWRTPEGRFYRAANPDSLYDSMVEVIDVTRGNVRASQRMPMWLLGFVDDNTAYGYSEPGNQPRIEIWRLEAHEGRQRRRN